MIRIFGLFLLLTQTASAWCPPGSWAKVNPSGYVVETQTMTDVVLGQPIPYQLVMKLPDTVINTTRISPRAFIRNPLSEIFARFVQPHITKNWQTGRYELARIVRPQGNEVMLGFDGNHAYLVIYKNGIKQPIKAHGGPGLPFVVRENATAVNEGVFFRFPNLSDAQLDETLKAVNTDTRYASCTDAACSVLKRIGVNTGTGDVPVTTEGALTAIVRDGFRDLEGQPLSVEVFSLSPQPFEKLLDDSIKLSQTKREIRKRSYEAFLAVMRHGSGNALRFIFTGRVVPAIP